VGGPVAVATLRAVLAGTAPPRELPEEDRLEPGGSVIGHRPDPRIPAGCGERAVAG
jgi:hypothetical protein